MNSLSDIEPWLKSRHISVNNEWIQDCVRWQESENEGRNITVEKMKVGLYEQWLFCDLREIGLPVFPPALSVAQKIVLTGNYAVQVMSIRDVSQPAYAQLMKARGTENENAKVSADSANESTWEPKSKRMLMLDLTDGAQNVQAMEYQSIPALRVDLPPGIKLLISGPISCNLGVLRLTAERVRVLGGDVESLAESNHYVKTLVKQLNKENDPQFQFNHPRTTNVQPIVPQPQIADQQITDLDDDFGNDDEIFNDLSPSQFNNLEQGPGEDVPDTMADDMDNDFEDVQDLNFNFDSDGADAWSESEYSSAVKYSSECKETETSKLSSLLKSSHVNIPNRPSEQNSIVHKLSDLSTDVKTFSSFKSAASASSVSKNSSNFNSESERRKHEKLFQNLRAGTFATLKDQNEFCRESEPFTYLRCIIGQKQGSETYVIKGFISSLTSKLTIMPGIGWNLRVLINDGTAALEVDISNELLSKFIGFTVQDVAKIKAEASSDPSSKARLSAALAKCEETLRNLNCLMMIKLEPAPVLFSCKELEMHHIQHLLNRVLKNS